MFPSAHHGPRLCQSYFTARCFPLVPFLSSPRPVFAHPLYGSTQAERICLPYSFFLGSSIRENPSAQVCFGRSTTKINTFHGENVLNQLVRRTMQPRPSLPLIHALYVCCHHVNKLRVAWSLHKGPPGDLIHRVPVPVVPASINQRSERMFHGMRLHAKAPGCLRVKRLVMRWMLSWELTTCSIMYTA